MTSYYDVVIDGHNTLEKGRKRHRSMMEMLENNIKNHRIPEDHPAVIEFKSQINKALADLEKTVEAIVEEDDIT